ncbi:MAG: type II toxin-antitoxin system HicA family toxin [Paludibacter sp.]|nr:type II toxin-antitoxin system HicA family toxin [Paludibacter sp.]
MKYSELERKIKKHTKSHLLRRGKRHPVWINEDTGDTFEMSNHPSEEVASGTLKNIMRLSGLDKYI